jgi:hypothetical protein
MYFVEMDFKYKYSCIFKSHQNINKGNLCVMAR